MSIGDTLLQLLFCFIVSMVYGAYLPRSHVGFDGLLLLLLLLLHFCFMYLKNMVQKYRPPYTLIRVFYVTKVL